jgi:hypothetical protein
MSDFEEFDKPPDPVSERPIISTAHLLFAVFCLLSLFFILLTSITFAVPHANYKQQISQYPDLDFAYPSTAMVVVHFFCGFSGALLFACLAIMSVLDGHPAILIAGLVVSGCMFLIFWIAYGIVAGVSDEFEASGNLLTFSGYTQYVKDIAAAMPGVTISASSGGDPDWTCTLDSRSAWATSANDSSKLPSIEPNRGRVSRIATTLSVSWTSESEAKISQAVSDLEVRLSGRVGQGMIWTVSDSDICRGYKEQMIVSDDERLPSQFDKAKGIAAAVFWSAIVHAFEVDGVPIVRGSVVKWNAVIGALPSAASFGSPVCHRTSSDDHDTGNW